jgi:hypothetical protein
MLRGDELKEQLRANPEDGVIANNLLREFHRGYDLANLEQLLQSENEEIVKAATWIGSEIGASFRPLLHYANRLLRYPSKHVRFFAIDCVLDCATSNDGDKVAGAVECLSDAEAAVRWKAMVFLTRATEDQLRAALLHYAGLKRNSSFEKGIHWLLSETKDSVEIERYIEDDDIILRKFGAVAVARLKPTDNHLAQRVLGSDDSDIRAFAEDMLTPRNPN